MKNIESKLKETRSYDSPRSFSSKSNIDKTKLEALIKDSKSNPSHFWSSLAKQEITWIKDFSTICSGTAPNYKWFEQKYSQFIYVDRIVIDPSFQSRGLGRAFYDDLKIFSQLYTPIITCEVNLKPKNEGSLLFHRKYGFEQMGTQKTEGGKKEVSLMVYKIP